MHTFVFFLHIVISIFLILIVLLQAGKGASIGAVFGGASNQTLFGSTGPASLLSKLTALCAIIFMLTSLYLAYFSMPKGGASIVEEMPVKEAPLQVSEPVTDFEKVEDVVEKTPVKEDAPLQKGE